ncbi:IS66 family insertion sequence element accessory protein TnpA [Pseudoalteromonas piscicida]
MPKHKTAQQWFTLIEQQALSGLSVTDFCQQHKLSTKSFYYHRAKHHKKKAPQKSQSSFVTAQPAVPAPASQPPLFQLKHGQSTVLLPSTTDTLWLAALLRALS